MHDIKWIRDEPAAFDAAMQRRGLSSDTLASSAHILQLDTHYRDALNELQELQQQRNAAAKAIGMAKKNGEDASQAMQNAQAIKEKIEQLESASANNNAVESALATLPNRLSNDVPAGNDEDDNKELRTHGNIPSYDFDVKDHVALGEELGWLDFEQAAKVSGARFNYLKGPLARLERALASFMLDMHTQEFGYEEIVPPTLVRDDAAFGTGQLPKFKEDLFQTTDGRWLIPTAEVVLANLVRESIIDTEKLPLRFTAFTPCYRSEAGSAGRDTRGMIRQHQFSKVELVSITTPEESAAEHERMTNMAETVLKRLDLPFRTMLLCAGDTGFSAHKTYDIEVWLPSQNTYREISSVSNCGDFQARRMKARFRAKGEKQTQFPHMLNGSALALGRCLIAILENYQQADGSVSIPERLIPYMNGMTTIEARP